MKLRVKTKKLIAAVFATALLLLPAALPACEGCKSSAQEGGKPNEVGQAFGYSIYFMLACPFMLVGGMVWVGARQLRRLEQERALGASSGR